MKIYSRDIVEHAVYFATFIQHDWDEHYTGDSCATTLMSIDHAVNFDAVFNWNWDKYSCFIAMEYYYIDVICNNDLEAFKKRIISGELNA